MALVRQRVNPELENDILTAFITNTHFTEQAAKWYKPAYFSDYTAIIGTWAVDYWQQYREAPGKNIQNIYNVKKDGLDLALAQNIATYLNILNDHYEQRADFNLPHMIDQAHVFFKRRAYEQMFTQGRELVMAGQVDDAITLHNNFQGIAQAHSRWENPLDPKVVRQHFIDREADIHRVFRFLGALGDLVGDLEVGWLVAWLGPMKRGKSFWIQECLFRSAIAKQNTAYINLEMIDKGVRDREYARLTGLTEGTRADIQFPMFDCYYNQCGDCPVSHMRKNGVTLRMDDIGRTKPVWGTAGLENYEVCTACRDDPELVENWLPDMWYSTYNQERQYNRKTIETAAGGFVRMFGDRIRHITYPAYSVTITQIQEDLEELAYAHDFRAKTVLVDYADIVAPEIATSDDLSHLSQVWKAMKRAAGETQALWITGSQTTRGAIERDHLVEKDVAGDIRKLAHVDVMLSINQTPQEKEDLFTRLAVLAHRHKKFSRGTVAVLHQLEIGLPYIDSEPWWEHKEEKL